jgi:hypothetical protein
MGRRGLAPTMRTMFPSRPGRAATARALASTFVVCALVPAAVEAARPRALLARGGVRVTARLAASGSTTVPVGHTLVVRVRSRRGAPGAAVTVRRLSAAGKRGRPVARRRLRNGSLRARLSSSPGVRYRVSARVGSVVRSRTLRTAAPAPAPVPTPTPAPAPAPTPAPAPPSGPVPCGTGLTVTLGTPVRTVGPRAVDYPYTVPATVSNTGPASVWTGQNYEWDRLYEGEWQRVPPTHEQSVIAPSRELGPGGSFSFDAGTGPSMGAGTFRLQKDFDCESRAYSSYSAEILSAPIELPAP